MAVRLRCRDRNGREVVLTEERWSELTGLRRAALLHIPNVDAVIERTLGDPNFATFDSYERRCYYRREDFPVPYDGLWTKVVTYHPHRWSAGARRVVRNLIEGLRGDVIDVDIVARAGPGETMWWPPKM